MLRKFEEFKIDETYISPSGKIIENPQDGSSSLTREEKEKISIIFKKIEKIISDTWPTLLSLGREININNSDTSDNFDGSLIYRLKQGNFDEIESSISYLKRLYNIK